MSVRATAGRTVVACVACGACGFLAARGLDAGPRAASGRQAVPQDAPGWGSGATASAPRGGHGLVEHVGGRRFTVLEAHQGVTFRGAAVEAGHSAQDAAAWEAPGTFAVPFVSITMLVEPDTKDASASVSFDAPTWGWPMEAASEGGRTTPALRYAFASETIIPGVNRPGASTTVSSTVRVPPVADRSELKTIIIYGRRLPDGAATFTAGVSVDGTSVGTLRFVDLPVR